jgi:hypothetical protein
MDWLSLLVGLTALAILAGTFIALSGGNGTDCDGSCKQGRKTCDCRPEWEL